MNPDVIFLTSSTVLEYDENQLKTDPVWSKMKAVSSGKVYRIPAKIDSWDLPGIAPIIGTFFMLHSMYPDHFSEQELQKEIDDYYTFMFGRTFTREYLGY
jgi:ABC-type Fe3+-hydroxamate transport system substrate-binding protein